MKIFLISLDMTFILLIIEILSQYYDFIQVLYPDLSAFHSAYHLLYYNGCQFNAYLFESEEVWSNTLSRWYANAS